MTSPGISQVSGQVTEATYYEARPLSNFYIAKNFCQHFGLFEPINKIK